MFRVLSNQHYQYRTNQKLRSNHQLRIKTGRYENIPRHERICLFCTSNKIEDENHFLLDCKAYSQIRDIFFSKLETKITTSLSAPEIKKFVPSGCYEVT